ncbi:MAG: hypothetical protein ACO3S5_02960 [Ilumatobacteraceae bacterium]|jgi:hypothetical protein
MHAERPELEAWFIRRGVPHFIEPYVARHDIWTRAVPVLVVAYLAGGLYGLDLAAWSIGRNVAAAGIVLLILVVSWVVTNVVRRRPALSRPRHIGVPELAVFLIGPTLPSIAFRQWTDAVQALAEGVAVLSVIYVSTSYGVVPLVRWAGSQLLGQVSTVGRMLARALPLLLLFTTFLFINAEVWQVAGSLDGPAYVIVLSMFFLLGSIFVLSRVPASIRAVNDFDDWGEVDRLVEGTPATHIPLPTGGDPSEIPLTLRQQLNIGLVSLFSQAIVITVVAVSLFAFFLVFGFLAVPESTIGSWTQAEVGVLLQASLGGRDLVVSEQLLRVAAFLGAFSGMYFTVIITTDATYRTEFGQDAIPEIRQALAVRLAYRFAAAQR